jgi:hypothetical protein
MKRMLPTTQYYFSAGSNYIDFSMYPNFEPKRLLAVINTTVDQTLIYATGGGSSSATGGSFSGTLGNYQLTLDYSTSSMADTDILQIIYDESVGTEEAKASIDVVSGKSGLDVNLLNSSFGGTLDDVLPAPFSNNALSFAVLNGGVLSAPAMNVNNELIVDVTQNGAIPVALTGVASTDLASFNGGNGLTPTQPLPATPTNPATGAYQTFGSGVSDANTQRVVIASNQVVSTSMPDLFITGQATQTAIVANILTDPSGATSTDAAGYRSGTIQVVSTGTAGTFILEGSNDNVTFQAIPMFNHSLLTGAAIVAAVTATVSQNIFVFPIQTRYIRLRIVTTITGGSIRAHTRLSQAAFASFTSAISQPTAGNLNATVVGTLTSVGTVTTVSSITAAQLSAVTVTDIALLAITTTQTSANISTNNTSNMAFQVNVTATSGTGQFMDVVVQETFDGTNYFDIYHFPRITAIGQYQTPQIRISGAGIRYVRTVGGITPSFTNIVVRPSRHTSSDIWRNFVNRTIDPNTLNSTTPTYLVEGCDQFQLAVTMNAGGTAPIFKLVGSNDNLNFYDVPSTTLTATVGTSVQVVSSSQCLPKFIKAVTSTAGIGSSLFCLCITARGV